MAPPRATTIFLVEGKSFRADLLASLHGVIKEAKTHTSAKEAVIKSEIAQILEYIVKKAQEPLSAPGDIEGELKLLSRTGVRAVTLAGTSNLLEWYGGFETNMTKNVGTIKTLAESFRIGGGGKGVLDYGEDADEIKQAETPQEPSSDEPTASNADAKPAKGSFGNAVITGDFLGESA